MLTQISDAIIPLLIFGVVGYGLLKKVNVYDAFLKGAWDGLKIAVKVMPTMVGLMLGIGILRNSGLLEFIGKFGENRLSQWGIGSQFMPLVLIKMFSSSAATGLVLDIFKTYGPDSRMGMLTSIMMSCTETCFYTMSVYFMAAKVTKTRWTLPGALAATFAGVVASVIIVMYIGC